MEGVGLCDGPKVIISLVTVWGKSEGPAEVTGRLGLQDVSVAGSVWLVARDMLVGLETPGELLLLGGREEVEGAVAKTEAGLVAGEAVCGEKLGEAGGPLGYPLVPVVAGKVEAVDAVSRRPWVWV